MIYLLLAFIITAIVVVWMRGGKLSRLGEVAFRLWWIVPLIAVVQSLVIRHMHSTSRLSLWHLRPLTMVFSYLVLWVVVFLNRHLPGMWIALAGVTLNLIPIAANGGYMPITPRALALIGAGDAAYELSSASVVLGSKDILLWPDEAHFWMLGDVFVIPEPFPWPTAMSVGDVVLAVGIFFFILRTAELRTHTVALSYQRHSEYPSTGHVRWLRRDERNEKV
jgi:hypothetical protein